MPLSKAKNRERMRGIRATCVQPNLAKELGLHPILEGDVLHMVNYKTYNKIHGTPHYEYDDGSVQPIPNCPDGRYR